MESTLHPQSRIFIMLLLILYLSLFSCQLFQSERAPFYVARKVYLPISKKSTSKNSIEDSSLKKVKVKEICYLLYTSGENEKKNYDAIEMALKGQWEEAKKVWLTLHETGGCKISNNLALSLYLLGSGDKSISYISKAISDCPKNDSIEQNFRIILKSGPEIKALYNHE